MRTNTTRREFLRMLTQAGAGAGLAGLLGGCRRGMLDAAADDPSAAQAGGLEPVAVAADNWGFVGTRTGRAFVPIGCNYYDPETGRWAPRIWSQFVPERVARHFELMEGLGVNVCRVFLSAGTFMPEAGKLSAEEMDKLDTMVSFGRRHGVRFVLSALNSWEGRADWRVGDPYIDPRRIELEGDYLEQMSRHFRGDGAVFAFDIINEPRAPWGPVGSAPQWPAWLREHAERTPADRDAIAAYLGENAEPSAPPNRAAEDDPILYAFQRYRESLAGGYVRDRAAAIRRGDADRLVTIGLVQYSFPLANRPSGYSAFNPHVIAEHVDYMSPHFYPILPDDGPLGPHIERMRRYAKAWVRYAYAGKPVVLEEFGWAGGGTSGGKHFYSEQDQIDWNGGLIERTEDSCCGWLIWPFADTTARADISKDAGFYYTDWRPKAWAGAFQALSARLRKNPPRRVPGRRTVALDMRKALTTMGEKIPMYDTRFGEALFAELAKDGAYDVVEKG